MAINYEKVGWDTTKYFNPTNMNHMDDGIKAACDKADANESAIAEVNSNLTNLMNEKGYYSGSMNDLKTTGLYYASGATDCPSSKDGYGLVVVFSLGVVFQIYVGYFGYPSIRIFNYTSGEWNAWKDL